MVGTHECQASSCFPVGYFSSGRSKEITFIERTYYMQVLCLGDHMWGIQRAASGIPTDGMRVRMGSLRARRNREHCGPVGGVKRGLTDVT